MRNVCIIPAYDRPEYLHLCLEKIIESDNFNEYKFIIALDYGFHPENLKVIDYFTNNYNFDCTVTAIQQSTQQMNISAEMKQSYNILYNYSKFIGIFNPELMILIEDDIMIGKDFFTMHELIHKTYPDIFVSILSQPNNFDVKYSKSEDDVYIAPIPDYQSLGVCFNTSKLIEYILPHHNDEYYINPNQYLLKHFPNSKYNGKWWEQDGLIRRVFEKHDIRPIYSCQPRCYHSGYYGYHRIVGRPPGNLNNRILELRKIIFNQDMLDKKQTEYKDSFVCNLHTTHTKLNLVNYNKI